MDFSLSEICSLLGDSLQQYNRVAKKRRRQRERTLMKPKIAKLTLATSTPKNLNDNVMPEFTLNETPKSVKKPPTPASFSSATKVPIRETPQRRVMRVHKKVISIQKRLIFHEDEVDD